MASSMTADEIIHRLSLLGVKAQLCGCGCSSVEIDPRSLNTAICKECCVAYTPDEVLDDGFCESSCRASYLHRSARG
jgi:hypothetical protein